MHVLKYVHARMYFKDIMKLVCCFGAASVYFWP
jgi:hypothetical protein